MVAQIKARYERSWFGQPTGTSRGRTILVGVSIIVLFVAVWWLGLQNAQHERDQLAAETAANERARQVSEYVTCLQSVEAGAQIEATAISGVEHAESTATLWLAIVEALEQALPDSLLAQAISVEVDRYVLQVAEFRRVAEEYDPPQLVDCGTLPDQIAPD
jgi:flagellar biosynthesis regulator FlaF